jgi:hypothetical protein
VLTVVAHLLLAQASPEAVEKFTEQLKNDPHLKRPDDEAERAAFKEAKERLYPKPSVRLLERPAKEGRFVLELVDPWALVDSVEWYAGDEHKPLVLRERKVEGPRAPDAKVVALANDRTILARQSVHGALSVDPSSKQATVIGSVLTAAAIASLATAVGLAISASNDTANADRAQYASEVYALDRSAAGKATGAWLSLAGAGVFAVGAFVAFSF